MFILNLIFVNDTWNPSNFPATIPFWVTVEGLPDHYWANEPMRTIGEKLREFMA